MDLYSQNEERKARIHKGTADKTKQWVGKIERIKKKNRFVWGEKGSFVLIQLNGSGARDLQPKRGRGKTGQDHIGKERWCTKTSNF